MALQTTQMSPLVKDWDTWLKLTEIERNIDTFLDLSEQYEAEQYVPTDTLYEFDTDAFYEEQAGMEEVVTVADTAN